MKSSGVLQPSLARLDRLPGRPSQDVQLVVPMLADCRLPLAPPGGPTLLRACDPLAASEPGSTRLALPGAYYSAVPCRLNGSGAALEREVVLRHGLIVGMAHVLDVAVDPIRSLPERLVAHAMAPTMSRPVRPGQRGQVALLG